MDHRFKSKWESNFIFDDRKDRDSTYQGLISLPQRNFTCSFCNKEYKSAQALGGHMNVHRRDRARLRLSSPPSSSLDDRPNPNYGSPPLTPVRYLPYNTYHSPIFPLAMNTNVENEAREFVFAHSARDFLGYMRKKVIMKDDEEKEGEVDEENGIRAWKEKEFLMMGLVKDGKIEWEINKEKCREVPTTGLTPPLSSQNTLFNGIELVVSLMDSIMLHHEEVDDHQMDLQDGRSYECIYCKHGFTSAQALGGHMNVHRKDRAKSRSNIPNSSKINTRVHYQLPCLITHEFMSRPSPLIKHGKHGNPNGLITSTSTPSQEEMRLSLSLSLQFEDQESIQEGNDEGNEGLDLELRLGYDP
ncbi:hypothetical protein LXL04_018756 [Taraxacum kok-saghyz]